MIETKCICGKSARIPEGELRGMHNCAYCSKPIVLVCGEELPFGEGAADFDGRLTVYSAPNTPPSQMFLGGIVDLHVGREDDCHIIFRDTSVSRRHAVFKRVDFGPSKWRVIDHKSRLGTIINGQRQTDYELQPGDEMVMGNVTMRFEIAEP